MIRILIFVWLVSCLSALGGLTNGLVAYYPFNGTAADASGNHLNGTVYRGILVPDNLQHPSSAFYLNGTNAYIYFGLGLPDMQSLTVAAWVKSYGGGTFFADADWQYNNDFTIRIDATNTDIRCDKPPAPVLFHSSIPLSTDVAGSWHHLAWVITTNLIQVYIDGEPNAFSSTNAGAGDVGYHDFVIGTMEFPQGSLGWAGYWKGAVSKLRIYNRALSAAEVAQVCAHDSAVRVGLIELTSPAVLPVVQGLIVGATYQLQTSTDLENWTNQSSMFTATNSNMIFPTTWDVQSFGHLFFRLQTAP